jgi:hypothetical protein
MLALYLSSTPLDLYPTTSISITMLNPLFDKDSIQRTFSYPFKIPKTAHNRSLFKHRGRLDARGNSFVDNATLHIQGLPFEQGVLQQTGSDQDSYKVVFKNTAVKTLDDLAEIRINEILETIEVEQIAATVFKFSILDPATHPGKYFIRINEKSYIYEKKETDNTLSVGTAFSALINADYPAAAKPTPEETGKLEIDSGKIPDMDIRYTSIEGFTLDGFVESSQANQSNMQAFIATLLDTPDDRFGFPVIENYNLYDEKNPTRS